MKFQLNWVGGLEAENMEEWVILEILCSLSGSPQTDLSFLSSFESPKQQLVNNRTKVLAWKPIFVFASLISLLWKDPNSMLD